MREKIKDVIAGIFSIFFIAVVFYLYFIQFFHGTFYFTFLDNDKTIIYNQTQSNSCHINAVEPTIILRMDDVRAYSKLTKPLVDEIMNRNISVTLGVIPKNLETDKDMIKYLIEIKANPNIEIAQHGNLHEESDKNISEESLLEGYGKIQNIISVVPVTYIPPYNEISKESKDIVGNYFRIISGTGGLIKEGEKIAEIGQTIATYYYTTNEVVPLERIISKCEESLNKTNICVINIHPQEYATNINNPVILDKNRFEEYKNLLDELENLNTKFSRFTDVIYCSSNINQ